MKYVLTVAVAIIGCLLAAAFAADAPAGTGAAKPDAPAGQTDTYAKTCDLYLQGQWDELTKQLATPVKNAAPLTPAQQGDIAYIRQTLAECQQPWWKQTKAAKSKMLIHPSLWGQTLNCTFDPEGKPGVNLEIRGQQKSLTLAWAAADMDSSADFEHGFTKGDATNLAIWSTLGQAMVYATITPAGLGNAVKTITEEDKLLLNRYLTFRASISGAYYGTPRARRWGVFLSLLAFRKETQGDVICSVRALGSAVVAEVAANPAKFPSLKLPDPPPAEDIEADLALHLKAAAEGTGWTVAEDKLIRDAIRALAAANGNDVTRTGKLTLPNGQAAALASEKDAELRVKRDAWLKAALDKNAKTSRP